MWPDIDRFDKFVGEPLIRKHYERMHKDEEQQNNINKYFEMQAQQNQMMKETFEKLAK